MENTEVYRNTYLEAKKQIDSIETRMREEIVKTREELLLLQRSKEPHIEKLMQAARHLDLL